MSGKASAIMDGVRFNRGRRGSVRRAVVRAAVLPAHRFARCVRGVAAVEFGLIAPIMLVLLLGAVEVTRAVSIDRRFSTVASMIADLVAREERLSSEDVAAIYDVVAQAMSPFDAGPLKISIIPVKGRNGQTVSYVGPESLPAYNGGDQPGRCQSVPVTPGLIESGGGADSVIIVNATYSYRSLFGGEAAYRANWEHQAFAKPRKRSCVDFEGPNSCVTACP